MISAFLGGLLIGFIFFGGLYLTTSRLHLMKYPPLIMILSTVIRMAILLGGFYLLMDNSFVNLVLSLVGVVIVRIIMVFTLKYKVQKQYPKKGEG